MAPLVFLCSQRKHTVKQFCQLWSSGTLIMKVSCTGSCVYLQDILKENTEWNSFVDYDPGWVCPACIVWRAKSVHFASWANFLVKVQTESFIWIENRLGWHYESVSVSGFSVSRFSQGCINQGCELVELGTCWRRESPGLALSASGSGSSVAGTWPTFVQ